MNNLTTFYIVRHGESEWNPTKRIQGHSDVLLTKKGEDQAEELFSELKNVKFDSIYASDLIRTVRTAEILSNHFKKPVNKISKLRQRNYAELEGQHYDVLKVFDSKLKSLDKNERLDFKYTDLAESDKEVIERVFDSLDAIAKDNPNKQVLIVIHGEVMRLILIGTNYTSYGKIGFNSIENSACIICESDGKSLKIIQTKGVHFG